MPAVARECRCLQIHNATSALRQPQPEPDSKQTHLPARSETSRYQLIRLSYYRANMKNPTESSSLHLDAPSPRPDRSRRVLAGLLLLGALLYLAVSWLDIGNVPCLHGGRRPTLDDSPLGEKNRVPLEAHVMSKCPDARDCLQKLVVPAMEQVNDKVDFELSFIARCGADCLLFEHVP